ncbi:MAG: gliding motility-associated ABC transporter substrate-binding protein GldG [Paludibacteraceae bacterium]
MKKYRDLILTIIAVALVGALPLLPFFRLDLTAEKRFSIAEQTRQLVQHLPDDVTITFYSGGDIDANFARLNRAAAELIDELNIFANRRITYKFINPSEADNDTERHKNYFALEQRGLRGMSVASRDANGRVTQNIVFPWAEVVTCNDTMAVCMLQPDGRREGEQGINNAIENLEFEFTDAIRILSKNTIDKIAFIEGHDEWSEEEVYAASEAFSRYFQIDRGSIGHNADILADYKAIIIAAPKTPFAEHEKYIIDQYIMNGGRVMWLIDGIQMQQNALTQADESAIIPLDVNLQDQLFRYGVRITSTVVQDMQCTYMPVNISMPGEQPQFEAMPWFYAPLLLTSPNSPITRNLMQVKADFASVIDFTNNTDTLVTKEILLITSNATHISHTPCIIDIQTLMNEAQDENYWFTRYQPVAALLQGHFTSTFPSRSRSIPDSIVGTRPHRDNSVDTRMLVVADGDIIRNDLEQTSQGWRVVPLGYDRITHMTFGNRDFLLNALLYLTDDQDWLSLRNRQFKLRLLNKVATQTNRRFWQWSNTLIPLILLLITAPTAYVIRRKRYGREA